MGIPTYNYTQNHLTDKQKEIRRLCEADLKAFVALVSPHLVLGHCHLDMLDFLTTPDVSHQLVLWPRGHLKAQRLDCKVLTPTGWSTIGEVTPGSLVIGSSGKAVKVTQTHPISQMRLFKVKTRDGRETICNDEHLWTITCPQNTGKKLVTKSLREIRENYKSLRFDKRSGKEYTEYKYFIQPAAPIEFEEKQLPIDPYTLGLWLGDGTSASGQITSADPEIFEYVPYTVEKKKPRYLYLVKDLHSKLRLNGLLKNKHIPTEYLFSSVEQRLALLQGIVDTDGTIQMDGKRFGITTKSKVLCDGYVALVRSLGGTATVGDTWCSSYVGGEKKHYFSITARLPQGLCPTRLKRKAAQWLGSIKTKTAITEIIEIDSGLGRCISVDAEDGIYITDDYLPTHNSTMIALWSSWHIIKNPETTILYSSATASLAYLQLGSIKNVITSEVVTKYWPGLCNPEEGKRETWRQDQIAVDHWKRKHEAIRDPTVLAVGMGANITGTHFDVVILDDVVVYDNCTTPDLRRSTSTWYSLLSSILNPGGMVKAVGTRYHPNDLYQELIDMEEERYDEAGNETGVEKVFQVSQKVVEKDDEFLWPRSKRKDGKWFGFDKSELSKKRAAYLDRAQFFAQYYNDPTDPGTRIVQEFDYYERENLVSRESRWYLGNRLLNIFAAIDFASTMSKKSDYTCIVVIGMDTENNIFVLDINRFKTDKISVMQDELLKMYAKWKWQKLRGEATAAQNLVVNQIKEFNKKKNIFYTIEIFKPSSDKLIRIKTTLEPRYANKGLWHYRGGNCQLLEDELLSDRPPHDDIKDALASAVEIASPPIGHRAIIREDNVVYNVKFGGVA